MSTDKSKATTDTDKQARDGLANFYFPEVGRTIRAASYKDAVKELNSTNELNEVSDAAAGEDKAK